MGRILTSLIFGLTLVSASGNGFFFGLNAGAPFGGAGLTPGLTVGTNWPSGSCSTISCAITSATETLSGVTTTIKFTIGNGHSCQFSKNGGSFTSFSSGDTFSYTNLDTLAFKIQALEACGSDSINVTDNSNGAVIGSFDGVNTHTCL